MSDLEKAIDLSKKFDVTVLGKDDVMRAVDQLVTQLATMEARLDVGYARIGMLLVEVSEKGYWKEGPYKSFNDYLEVIAGNVGRGRTQLYHYFSTVRDLKEYVTEEQLDQMGIAKAKELKKAVNGTGQPPTPTMIEAALDPTKKVSDIQQQVFEETNQKPENTSWIAFDGFYGTDEDRATINDARKAILAEEPAVSSTVPEWVKRKEFILRLAMNYLADHTIADVIDVEGRVIEDVPAFESTEVETDQVSETEVDPFA